MAEKSDKKKLTPKEAAILRFIHMSCCPTTNGKRFKEMKLIFSSKFNFDENDCLKIWKGLFYILWYSEMSKCGEDIIYEMVYHCPFKNLNDYFIAGFKILSHEWFGIDYLRIDKYAHLVRHMTNRLLRWIVYECEENRYYLIQQVLDTIEPSVDLFNHFTEVYIQELNRVLMWRIIWNRQEKVQVLFQTLSPFILMQSRDLDKRSFDTINEYILDEIIQTILPREPEEVGKNLLNQLSNQLVNVGKEESVRRKKRNLLYNWAKRYKSVENKIKV
jgi:putative uncharacterized protein GLEAN_14963